MYDKRVIVLKKHLKDGSEIVGTLFLECNFGVVNVELVMIKNCKTATHLFTFNEKTAKFCKIIQNIAQINDIGEYVKENQKLHFVVFCIDENNKKVELIGMDCEVGLLNKYYEKLKSEIKKIFDSALKKQAPISMVPTSVNFFDKINERFFKVFDRGKDEVLLNGMFVNSKWKRVFLSGNFFVLGCLYRDEKIYAIGVGKPVASKNKIEKNLMQVTKFYPARKSCGDGFGYYLGFKDVITGKNINLTV